MDRNKLPAQEREMELFPRQLRFVQDQAMRPAAIGGIGSGKTFVGAAKTISRLHRKELGLICAPTYSILRDATQRVFFGMLDDIGVKYEYLKGDKHLLIPQSGHEILFRSLDDPNNLRGPNVSYAWIDEAAYISAEAWNVVKGRARVGDDYQTWITTTPKGRNWVWAEWVRDGHDNAETHTMYRFRTDENPYLPDGYAKSLGYVGQFAAQELEGEFVSFEGLVYEMFDRSKHVAIVDADGWRSVVTADIGARNPTAILLHRISGDGRRHIQREFYRPGLSSDEIIDAIVQFANDTNPETMYLDPSAADYIMALQRRGYPVRKANNAILFGIGRVKTAFADGMTIDPSCINLLAELEAYHWPENRSDADVPVKAFDHACDSLRYGIASEGEALEGQLVW